MVASSQEKKVEEEIMNMLRNIMFCVVFELRDEKDILREKAMQKLTF